ncbi:hypothetical protein SAMN02787100_4233 [Chryseobacterium sp. OV279]|nr:hypothetical protein SAMN02787100_4233 [Chryseobacterium sp. OV279]
MRIKKIGRWKMEDGSYYTGKYLPIHFKSIEVGLKKLIKIPFISICGLQ